jgi:hypothetical protein
MDIASVRKSVEEGNWKLGGNIAALAATLKGSA